jgi:hypothetical protein
VLEQLRDPTRKQKDEQAVHCSLHQDSAVASAPVCSLLARGGSRIAHARKVKRKDNTKGGR